MIVYVRDAVEIGYCIKGLKEACKRYNLDFRAIVKNGIDADDLLCIDNAMVYNIVEHARKRNSGET